MFDINKISLMYLVVVVIYFLAACQVDQASQAGTAGVRGKMHRYIYQSIRKLVIISLPLPAPPPLALTTDSLVHGLHNSNRWEETRWTDNG